MTNSSNDPKQFDLPFADMVDQVFEFNEKIIKLQDTDLNCLTEKQHEWLQKFCVEELDELKEAFGKQDMVGMIDAVLDLIYGAMGTFKKMGLTRDHVRMCFTAVHVANMSKQRGDKGRGSDEDATKPDGFVPPEEAIADILFLE